MRNIKGFQVLGLFSVKLVVLFWAGLASAQEPSPKVLGLMEAVELLKHKNPEIAAAEASANKESALIKTQYALPDPMLSYQRLERGNSTKYWGVSQRIEFPTSYIYRGAAQKHRARGAKAMASLTALELRGEVISVYYELYSLGRMIKFTEANRDAIREVARVAERKYASGSVSQADSMRAHVEQTSLEAEIRLLRQKQSIASARLKELLNLSQEENFILPSSKLQSPLLPELDNSNAASLEVQSAKENLLEAENSKGEAVSEFLPNIQVRYQRQFSGLPEDSQILMLEASVPLWFWGATGKTQAALYEQDRKSAELVATKNRVSREQSSLIENLKTQKELLDIYENALIPQAQTSYSATSSSYRASKASFLDLLERERFLLGVQIKSYSALIDYVRLLTRYEQVVGKEVIDVGQLQESL